jgi:hypothetical protein
MKNLLKLDNEPRWMNTTVKDGWMLNVPSSYQKYKKLSQGKSNKI